MEIHIGEFVVNICYLLHILIFFYNKFDIIFNIHSVCKMDGQNLVIIKFLCKVFPEKNIAPQI